MTTTPTGAAMRAAEAISGFYQLRVDDKEAAARIIDKGMGLRELVELLKRADRGLAHADGLICELEECDPDEYKPMYEDLINDIRTTIARVGADAGSSE